MTTLAQVRDKADQRLTTLWTNVIRPKELAYFLEHGEYGQCLYTQNLPDNKATDPAVRELLPVTDRAPHDRWDITAEVIFGKVNIDVALPFALAVNVYNGPQGQGFVGQVWVKYEGTIYTRTKNYGPESWRTHDWREITVGVAAMEGMPAASFASRHLPTFSRWASAVADFARRLFGRA